MIIPGKGTGITEATDEYRGVKIIYPLYHALYGAHAKLFKICISIGCIKPDSFGSFGFCNPCTSAVSDIPQHSV